MASYFARSAATRSPPTNGPVIATAVCPGSKPARPTVPSWTTSWSASTTARHYDFKQRLLNKAREYPWVRVKIVDEAYTSKTCGCCGVLNETLGGSKKFHCKSCGTAVDRDVNGARNIAIKNHQEW